MAEPLGDFWWCIECGGYFANGAEYAEHECPADPEWSAREIARA